MCVLAAPPYETPEAAVVNHYDHLADHWETIATRPGNGHILFPALQSLVREPTLTVVGVARLGVAEEDTALLRALVGVHPLAWAVAPLGGVGLPGWRGLLFKRPNPQDSGGH